MLKTPKLTFCPNTLHLLPYSSGEVDENMTLSMTTHSEMNGNTSLRAFFMCKVALQQ